MRIISRDELLKLGHEALVATYEPICFGEPFILTEASEHDFTKVELIPWPEDVNDSADLMDRLAEVEKGEPYGTLDYDCTIRDGLFDHEQKYAVFERHDLEILIHRLKAVLATMPESDNG